jgi:uncharacterized membrane protein
MQNRFTSKVALAALLPIILILGDTYNLWNIIGMPKTTFVQLSVSVGALLTAFGVFNNPNSKNKF